jgi:hypothetical protein
MNIERFCKSLSVIDLQGMSNKDNISCLELLLSLSKHINTLKEDNKYVYYLLLTYFKPVKIIDYVPTFTVPMSLVSSDDSMCRYLSKHPLSDNQIQSLFATTYNSIVLKGLKTDITNINNEYLGILFSIVDDVYFDGGLSKNFKNNKITVKFECTGKFTKTAGYCEKIGCVYTIKIGTTIFSEAFEKFTKQSNSGLFCYNPLMCILITFLHEITHLIIFVFCYNLGIDNKGHTKTFINIVKNLFGQTEYVHYLGRDTSDAFVKESDVSVNQKIWWKNEEKTYSGKITSKNVHTVSIGTWKIPYGLILLKHPEKTDITEIADVNDIKKKLVTGQMVWWKNKGKTYSGKITSKNPKTLSIGPWKVIYSDIILEKPSETYIIETIDTGNIKKELVVGQPIWWVSSGIVYTNKVAIKNTLVVVTENKWQIPYKDVLLKQPVI